jgi:hypothetical protein
MRDILFVVAVIALIVFWPLAAIWAVNTLFGFTIAYTFWNWLAVVVLTAFFGKTHVKVVK